jgi:hypothetical protein
MANTGVTTGVPTSTVNDLPFGSGSSKGFVHSLLMIGNNGYILKDSVSTEIETEVAIHLHI